MRIILDIGFDTGRVLLVVSVAGFSCGLAGLDRILNYLYSVTFYAFIVFTLSLVLSKVF
jgi:hypothetical protein